MKLNRNDNEVKYEAAMKLFQESNENYRKHREFLQNQVTDSQRLEALEGAVAESLDILKNLVAGENNVWVFKT